MIDDVFKNYKKTVLKQFDDIEFINGYDIDKILKFEKPHRLDPSEYLSARYIKEHLRKFEKEAIASRVILKKSYDDYGLGKPDKWQSEFVSLKSDIDKVLKDSNGDVKFISEALGTPTDQIKGGGLIRIDFKLSQRNKVFMPSGNEWEQILNGFQEEDYQRENLRQ